MLLTGLLLLQLLLLLLLLLLLRHFVSGSSLQFGATLGRHAITQGWRALQGGLGRRGRQRLL